jgi:hypothetical protein
MDRQVSAVKIGHWYLCAECPLCGTMIPIFEIEKNAQIDLLPQTIFPARSIPCQGCGKTYDLAAKSLRRLQAQKEEPIQ